MNARSFLTGIVLACTIAIGGAAIAAEAPAVDVHFLPGGGVTVENTKYTTQDAVPLRAKLDEIRARVPKPALSLHIPDHYSDADMESTTKLLVDAGIEQDIEDEPQN